MKRLQLLLCVLLVPMVVMAKSSLLSLNIGIPPVTRVGIVNGYYSGEVFPSALIGENPQKLTTEQQPFTLVLESNQSYSYIMAFPYPMSNGNGAFIQYTMSHEGYSVVVDEQQWGYLFLIPSSYYKGYQLKRAYFTVQASETTSEAEAYYGIFGVQNAPAGVYEGKVVIQYTVL